MRSKIKNSTVLLVHPYYSLPDFSFDPITYTDILPKEYLENLERLIRGHEGNVILLEEEGTLKGTKRRIKNTGTKAKIHFVKTMELSPHPKEIDWKELLEIINKKSNGNIVYLGGGFLGKTTYGGCLGFTADMLRMARISYRFIDGCVFDYDFKTKKAVLCD